MVQDVLVPQMGESVLEGTILSWKVKIGEKVQINQPLVELMTDKVNVEIPAEISGVLVAQFAKEGDVVPVGTRIATIDDGSAVTKEAPTAQKSVAAEVVAASTPVAAVAAVPRRDVKGTADAGRGKMSPKVKMLVREYGLDASAIVPTGKDGIVTVDDVMRSVEDRSASKGILAGPIPSPAAPAFAATQSSAVTPAGAPAAPKAPTVKIEIPVFAPMPANLKETRVPLQGARKLISEHMTKSKETSAHVTTFEEVDLTDLVNYRNEIKGWFKETYGANITFLPFVMKACTVALKEFPKINASLTEKEIIYKNYYNVGVAVAREEGLIVPVIKNADKKTIVELAVEIQQLGEKARTNRLMPDDVADGTFTLTNAGMFGATGSTPIISQPQVAILGIHAIVKKPWVVNDQIVIRDISNFGMSFDHRLIDGHTAVQFLHRVHEYLADGRRLLMNLR